MAVDGDPVIAHYCRITRRGLVAAGRCGSEMVALRRLVVNDSRDADRAGAESVLFGDVRVTVRDPDVERLSRGSFDLIEIPAEAGDERAHGAVRRDTLVARGLENIAGKIADSSTAAAGTAWAAARAIGATTRGARATRAGAADGLVGVVPAGNDQGRLQSCEQAESDAANLLHSSRGRGGRLLLLKRDGPRRGTNLTHAGRADGQHGSLHTERVRGFLDAVREREHAARHGVRAARRGVRTH